MQRNSDNSQTRFVKSHMVAVVKHLLKIFHLYNAEGAYLEPHS
jgi:hypothetical protein